MAAVIRVKRRIFEEPLDTLLINCKRRKIEENHENKSAEDSSISAILKLAGTLKTQNENLSPHLSKITKEEAQGSFKKHIPNITSKLRSQQKINVKNNRFKVTNCFRALDENITLSDPEKTELTIVDIEPSTDINVGKLLENDSKTSNNYVYDLYYMDDVDDMIIDHMLSDAEEGFIYSVDSEAIAFEEDVDDNDIQRYGERYARYRSRVLKELKEQGSDSDNDREDYYDCLNYNDESD